MPTRRIRIALYSHDSMGLGHMRRNMLLAEELRCSPAAPSVLLLTGSRLAARFDVSPGIDVITLPGLYKDTDASYRARSLEMSFRDLIALRSAALKASVAAFDPDVLIVDNVPRGAGQELDATFALLRQRGRTRCILGLRDILDDPGEIARQWGKAENFAAIRRTFDAIWIYGDERVTDAASEYAFPADLASRLRYTGFLDQRRRPDHSGPSDVRDAPIIDGRTILCLLGGGQDGSALAEAFAQTPIQAPFRGLLVTGPMMPDESKAKLRELAERNGNVQVVEFLDDPAVAMRRAHSVITMGGYNTVCDVLSFGSRALVVPRVIPRTEQLIRAERLAARGLVDMLHPDDATPLALADWIASATPIRVRTDVKMHTPAGLHSLLDEVIAMPSPIVRGAPHTVREVRHAS